MTRLLLFIPIFVFTMCSTEEQPQAQRPPNVPTSSVMFENFLRGFQKSTLPFSVDRALIRQSDTLQRIDSAMAIQFLHSNAKSKNEIDWFANAAEPRYGWMLPNIGTHVVAIIHSERYPTDGYNSHLFLTTLSSSGAPIASLKIAEDSEGLIESTEQTTFVDESLVLTTVTTVFSWDYDENDTTRVGPEIRIDTTFHSIETNGRIQSTQRRIQAAPQPQPPPNRSLKPTE